MTDSRDIRSRRAAQARRARTDKEALDRIAALLRGETGQELTRHELLSAIYDIVGLSGRITDSLGPDHDEDPEPETWVQYYHPKTGEPLTQEQRGELWQPAREAAGQDERYDADGKPYPYGRCDTCGAPCSAAGCMANTAHETALTGDEDEEGYEGIDASMAKEDRRNAWQGEGEYEETDASMAKEDRRNAWQGEGGDPDADDDPDAGDEIADAAVLHRIESSACDR